MVTSKGQVRMLEAAMGKPETSVADLCRELGCSKATLYRYVGPTGELRKRGREVLGAS